MKSKYFKELPFNVENAEKFPKAEIVTHSDSSATWYLTKDNSTVFFLDDESDWVEYSLKEAEKFHLKIEVAWTLKPLWIETEHGFELSGYSVPIDQDGDIVGEPFIV